MATLKATAAHLDMTDRNLRDVLKKINLNFKTNTQAEIRIGYIRHLRNQAAGRGGDEQQTLTKARTEESAIKAANLRLTFHRDIGTLIPTEDAAAIISLWCRQANIDYSQGFNKLIAEIQNKHKIKINKKMVEKIVSSTAERIKSHAEKLGKSLIESIDDIPKA